MVLAIASGLMGALASLIFWTIYYLQTFDVPVPELVRVESSAIGTASILIMIFAVMYRKRITVYFREIFSEEG